jgi:hypothetical protein
MCFVILLLEKNYFMIEVKYALETHIPGNPSGLLAATIFLTMSYDVILATIVIQTFKVTFLHMLYFLNGYFIQYAPERAKELNVL